MWVIIGITVIIGLVILAIAFVSSKIKSEDDGTIDQSLLEAEAIRVRLIQRAKCILCIRKIKELNGNYDIDLDKFFCGKCVE